MLNNPNEDTRSVLMKKTVNIVARISVRYWYRPYQGSRCEQGVK